jgi:hypothetical protein
MRRPDLRVGRVTCVEPDPLDGGRSAVDPDAAVDYALASLD